MYVRLGGRSLFERNICRVKRPLLGKLLTSLAVRYSSSVKKKNAIVDGCPCIYSSNHRLSLYDTIRHLSYQRFIYDSPPTNKTEIRITNIHDDPIPRCYSYTLCKLHFNNLHPQHDNTDICLALLLQVPFSIFALELSPAFILFFLYCKAHAYAKHLEDK